MKILIMNDLLVCGGAEIITLMQKQILENKNHEVYLVTFDENYPSKHKIYNINNKFINIPLKDKGLIKIYRKLFYDCMLVKKIRKVIFNIKPDIILINNLHIAPISQYSAIKGYNCIQEIHDYSVVCPNGTCIDLNFKICNGIKYNNCIKKCHLDIKGKLKLLIYKKVDNLRRNIVSKFITPSNMLLYYCLNHNLNTICINNPIDLNKLPNLKKNIDFENKIYFYFGVINRIKGVSKLIEAFNNFSVGKNVRLYIAGKIDKDFSEKFKSYLNSNNKINYLGYIEHDKIIKILNIVYCVIVPSLWMENYPTTVLEAMATRCLVLGSNRGGIPELLMDNRGFIFDILSTDDIINALERSFHLTKKDYIEIVNRAYNYVKINNNVEKYYLSLLNELH